MSIELAPNGKEKVTVALVGQDGNAFAILARCSDAMERVGWSETEIKDFRREAMSGDYPHLLVTVMDYCNDVSEDEEEEDEWEEEDD